ncbi:putative G-patch domain, GC-rich sequence DNA-binding factor domain-containing protein [Medicago truncatula]|nr:putative G-patch domain, GC-rich sequence DNA-binding factor domain-containing protein [Medicago truncatula]
MPNEDKFDDNKQEQSLGHEESVDVGKLENYNGMGMKLMEKMGYKGGGLGKNEQGILNPIEAKLRDKYSGLGFNISNETTTPLPSLETEKKSEPGEGIQPVVGRKKRRRYKNITSMLDRVQEENALALDSLAQYFRHMHKRYVEYYKSCKLACVAYSYALPLFIRVFQGLDPLRNPSHGLELVSEWKTLLLGDDSFGIQVISSPYTHLVSEVVLPAVRKSGINTWQARDPEPMLRFLDSWKKLLPSSVLATILDTIVMPKLLSAVDTWEPHRETIPIHTWVHPWLPLLGHKMEREGIYQIVRFKLSNALGTWHPSDGYAYAILSPWKALFDSDSWQQLIYRYIVPKLKVVLRDDFQVNPRSQNLAQFYWVMNWASAIPIHLMVDIMQIFFTKWLTVLYHWLCSNPNFGEVRKWYLDWKELIPKELLANESIRYKLHCGLCMMNQAVECMEVVQPCLKENISYIRASEQRKFETQQKAAASSQQQATASLGGAVNAYGVNEISVKELIEAYTQDHGLLFKPKSGRMHNGHEIYTFGNVSIIIDSLNQKVYAQNAETWSLETLEQLLELQNKFLSKRR